MELFWLVLQYHESSSQARPMVTPSKIRVLSAERRKDMKLDEDHLPTVLLLLHSFSPWSNRGRKAEDVVPKGMVLPFFFGRGNLNSFEHLNKQRPTALPPKFLYRAFQGVPRVSEIHLWVTKLRNPSKATQRFNLIPHIIQLLDSTMLFLIWFCCGYNACKFFLSRT